MFDLEFHKPGKSYKLVKTVVMTGVADSQGELTSAKVPVYLKTTGTPSFAVGLPKEYVDFYLANQSSLQEAHRTGNRCIIDIDENTLCLEQFDNLEGRLKWLAGRYAADVKTRKITKVIVLALSLRAEGVSVNPPSFADNLTHLAGLGARILYDVNGKIYYNRSAERGRDAEDGYLPEWPDLAFMSSRGSSDGHAISFSPQAWQTLSEIKDTLQRAAAALSALKNPTEAALLLSSGTLLLS